MWSCNVQPLSHFFVTNVIMLPNVKKKIIIKLMDTLILGHVFSYNKSNIRCSPIDVNVWYDKPFKCVDFMCDKSDADFVYDLIRSIDYRFYPPIKYNGPWVWKFAEDESYDTIIDCTGRVNFSGQTNKYRQQNALLKTILRVLKPNGIFYSYSGKYTKTNNQLMVEPIIKSETAVTLT